MDYDYRKSVTDDCIEAIKERIDEIKGMSVDDAYNSLYEDFFIDDSITGNASGSYTCSAYKAEEYLCHNLYLLKDAKDEFNGGSGIDILGSSESCDVTIRCYLLSECLSNALNIVDEEIGFSNLYEEEERENK